MFQEVDLLTLGKNRRKKNKQTKPKFEKKQTKTKLEKKQKNTNKQRKTKQSKQHENKTKPNPNLN